MKRLARILPPLLLLAFYWPALNGWFFQDDFGWLRLRYDLHSAADLPRVLFAPKAHGNMRPLGENAYWLVLGSAFGADALPFRIVTFATEIAALLLLGAIVRRLTKCELAAFTAPVLWIFSRGLAPSMGWSSIYNQVLCGFFFLLALYCLVRYGESGEPRWWTAQWIAFVLSLGALETNVVYPALALVYLRLYAPKLARRIWPLFGVSVVFAFIHFYFAPAPHAGPYAPKIDLRLLDTVATYWQWALGRMPAVAASVFGVVALAFALARARRREYLPLFGFAWFAATLAPYLPLPDHKLDYYLAAPTIGIAMIGAAAVAAARHGRVLWKLATPAALVLFLGASAPAAWTVTRWEYDRGRRAEDFVSAVADIRRADPAKAILLDNMDNDLFWAAMANLPFHALRIPEVFLAPNGTGRIQADPGFLAALTLPPELTLAALEQDRAVVFRFDGDALRNETGRYLAAAEAAFPRGTPHFINIGDPIFAPYLGAGWEAAADGYRSMRSTASLHIAGGTTLTLGVVRTKPFDLRLAIDGAAVPLTVVSRTEDVTLLRANVPSRPDLLLSMTASEPLTFGFASTQ